MAEIAIIIPVYNAERYIRRCMDSVLRQTYQDFEIILVNDGSADSSLALCQKFSRNDTRITVLDKPNGGAASARNMGLDWVYANSSCKWLCFIDIDDYIHERYLEILVAAAENKQTAISMCAYEVTLQDRVECSLDSVQISTIAVEDLWCERQINCTVPFSKLFKKELFREIRYPEGIIHEDEFTLYRVLFKCEKIAFVDLPLYGYFQTETSVMRGKWTPRHMTEPDGLLEQLKFFLKNQYKKAAKYTAKIYLFSIYRNLQGAKESKDYQPEMMVLRKRLRREILHFSRIAELSADEDWLFFEAFPVAMLPYKAIKKLAR